MTQQERIVEILRESRGEVMSMTGIPNYELIDQMVAARILSAVRPKMPESCGECPCKGKVNMYACTPGSPRCKGNLFDHYTKGDT